jgi:RimK family alpha-L-glutamate ligase
MKKMLVLTRFIKEYEPRRLAEEGRKKGFEVDMVKYGQVDLGIKKGRPVVDLGKDRKLSDYDLIIPRAASKKGSSMVGVKTVLLEEARRLGVKVVNGESFSKFPLLGKIEQGIMMAEANLPTVDFLTFGSKLGWRKYLERIEKRDFPLMVKGRFGSHGRTVKLVEDKESLEKVFSRYKEGSVLLQPKIKSKQWYRCIVVNGEYLGEMRHRQKGKYGGEEGKLVKFNKVKMERLKKICLEATRLFSCDYAGLDVIWDEETKDFKILEVNRTAQFKYFEKRTSVNVAEKILGE